MKYWKYFLYVVEHKWNVGIECVRLGMPFHAVTHDLSKFLPSEFIPYAKFFHMKNRTEKYNKEDETSALFQQGWNRHQKRNKHHWNYWVSVTRKNMIIPVPMPRKYVKQMIADWNGMSRKFGGNTRTYYEENKDGMILHDITVNRISVILSDMNVKDFEP